jgi:hypothetical protein
MPASKVATIEGFMGALTQVEGFEYSLEDLQRFAEQIPKDSGFKPTKSRGGVRAKTVYNHWCGTQWKDHCIKEYGKSLPLADVKDKESGEVKIDAHTKLRQEMYAAFQETEEYEILKKQVEEENKKLGKSTPTKKQSKDAEIKQLKKELAKEKKKNQMEEISDAEVSESDDDDDDDDDDEHTKWAKSRFEKSTPLCCFKAWIMSLDPDTYGEGKKKAISKDDLQQLKEEHDFDDYKGSNYTVDNCEWFHFIRPM